MENLLGGCNLHAVSLSCGNGNGSSLFRVRTLSCWCHARFCNLWIPAPCSIHPLRNGNFARRALWGNCKTFAIQCRDFCHFDGAVFCWGFRNICSALQIGAMKGASADDLPNLAVWDQGAVASRRRLGGGRGCGLAPGPRPPPLVAHAVGGFSGFGVGRVEPGGFRPHGPPGPEHPVARCRSVCGADRPRVRAPRICVVVAVAVRAVCGVGDSRQQP